jgi:hypothetical protein
LATEAIRAALAMGMNLQGGELALKDRIDDLTMNVRHGAAWRTATAGCSGLNFILHRLTSQRAV